MKSTVLLICLTATVDLLATAQSKSDEQGKDAVSQKANASDKFIGKEAGAVRDDNGLKMEFVWCPPGGFTMENFEFVQEHDAEKVDLPKDGAVDQKDEPPPKPRNTKRIMPVKVFLCQGYWLGKFEVTQAEWKLLMGTEPWKGRRYTKEGPQFPATWVDWDDAIGFCRKLTKQDRQAGRLPADWEYTLPTEAQWERACRAQTETTFSFGDDRSKLGDYAWFFDNSWDVDEDYAHQVGQKKANPWGLFDMQGNVWEWCRDIYVLKVPGGRDPEVKSDEKALGWGRAFRGGSWLHDASRCQSAYRSGSAPGNRACNIGFRVALSAVQPVK